MKRTIIMGQCEYAVREGFKLLEVGTKNVLGHTEEVLNRNLKKMLGIKTKKEGDKRGVYIRDCKLLKVETSMEDDFYLANCKIDKITEITEDEIDETETSEVADSATSEDTEQH